MRQFLSALACLLFFIPVTVRAQVDARMFRYPDVSATHIAFVYAGDLWIVPKAGGTASRLSSPPGEEQYPRFSPDGSRIAFTGNYDGNMDVYVMPAMGGSVERVTYHPAADRTLDWTPDGKRLLMASRRASGVSVSHLYLVDAGGGLPERLPAPYGEIGALSADGRRLAYTTKDVSTRTWKRYRGGLAPDIWVLDLRTRDARNVTTHVTNDEFPMWHGETLYFLSARGEEARSNIWKLDLASGTATQVTRFTDVDVAWPAIGPQDIVFQAGGRLYLLDLATDRHREVAVSVVTDLGTLRPRTENVSGLLQWAHVSPQGKRAVMQARGDLFTLPAEHGAILPLARSSGVAERYPAWSPDGTQVAYWSDRSGEYELTLRAADGSGDERTVTSLGAGYRYAPFWSPDGRKIAFIDHAQVIRILDVESGRLAPVDTGRTWLHGAREGFEVSWSADSRWMAYGRDLPTGNGVILLYDTQAGTRHQVTSGYYNDVAPAFDPDGKYLYYHSNRNLEVVYSDLDATWVYPNATTLVAAPLRADVPSPLAPRSDDEGKDPKDGKGQEGQKGPGAQKGADSAKAVAIDLDGFEARGVILPPKPGNYGAIRGVSGKLVFLRLPRTGSGEENATLAYYDLAEREEKTILSPVSQYEISADGKKVLVAHRGQWAIVELKAGQKMDKRLATASLETVVDPRAEWRQVFTDVWRTYRDVFYDPGLHGLDWNAQRAHYGRLLGDAVTRWDVNAVIGELIGEVNASHTYVGGGDVEPPRNRRVGLLGVDWALDGGAYRVARIVRGAPWDLEARSPLDLPGVDVKAGDYILAVNGVPLDPRREPEAAFEGLAGVTVRLAVNGRPTMDGARQVLVETLTSESRLRNLEWIEENRKKVEAATGGRVGYIYVPNTAVFGQTELVRQFNSQMLKDGLIIDERWNGGGQLADRFIEMMNREVVTRIFFRNGATQTVPGVNHLGAKVMLVNGWAGSGGDAFPWFFQSLKVGPVIGERTWGGLIGPATSHQTIDGGFYTAPQGRLYGPDGKWFAEGHGIDPDIVVTDDQGAMAKGADPQLEAGIAEVLRLMQERPVRLPDRPAFERR